VKINLYKCDICEKEHRRCDCIGISIYKNDSLAQSWDHLCSVCEEVIKQETDKLKAKHGEFKNEV
jgi:hypothetical protein